MKIILSLFILFACNVVRGQTVPQGQTIRLQFLAPSIKDNVAGEAAKRHLTIYLPPGYEKETKRYPVVYFLHGM
ncbi:MAG TPA: hypothetical protein VD794_17180, partial [Flavisolibacter sp.]|nr:hypothetical protein [Flavisolibacter sp.]